MPDEVKSHYESFDAPAVRPYLVVEDAAAAIAFYGRVFAAEEIERHATPSGGVGHAKLRLGEPPSDRPQQGVRGATVHDPFGLTWWLAGRLASRA